MTTLFIITDFVILTLEPITQFFPITDLEIKHFSSIVVPSPIIVSEGLSNNQFFFFSIKEFYFFSFDSSSLFLVGLRQRGGGFKKTSKFP